MTFKMFSASHVIYSYPGKCFKGYRRFSSLCASVDSERRYDTYFQKVKADLKQIKFRRHTCCLSNLAQANPNLFEASIGACLVEYLTYYYLN